MKKHWVLEEHFRNPAPISIVMKYQALGNGPDKLADKSKQVASS